MCNMHTCLSDVLYFHICFYIQPCIYCCVLNIKHNKPYGVFICFLWRRFTVTNKSKSIGVLWQRKWHEARCTLMTEDSKYDHQQPRTVTSEHDFCSPHLFICLTRHARYWRWPPVCQRVYIPLLVTLRLFTIRIMQEINAFIMSSVFSSHTVRTHTHTQNSYSLVHFCLPLPKSTL